MKAYKVFLFINIMKKLIVLNLKEFFEIGFNNQFKILSELEKQVVESIEIQETICVSYSDDGIVIFDLTKIEYKTKTIFYYSYTTTAS
jgi:hypothetical protein